MAWYEIIASFLVLFAAVMMLTTAVACWKAPNALTRANLMGPTVGVALPSLVIAKLVVDWGSHGFNLNDFVRALVAITALLVVASVASFYMARSVFGIEGDDLAVDPDAKEWNHHEVDHHEDTRGAAPQNEPMQDAPSNHPKFHD